MVPGTPLPPGAAGPYAIAADRRAEGTRRMSGDGVSMATGHGRGRRPTARPRALAILAALTAGLAAGPAPQAQVIIGGDKPSVTVDMGVLESLGPRPTLPDVLRGQRPTYRQLPGGRPQLTLQPPGSESQGAERIKLRPPRSAKVRPPARKRPSPPPAKKTETQQAARTPVRPPSPPAPPASTAPRALPAPPPIAAPSPPAPAKPPVAPSVAPPPVATVPAPKMQPEPAPKPAMTPPKPAETSVASRTPAAQPSAPASSGGPMALAFGAGSSTLNAAAKSSLASVAEKMKADSSLRLQLRAYASGTNETASRARRLSLSRALAVRSYLIDQGVRSTRIDVRALGNRVEGGSPDRVDVVLNER